MTVPLQVGRKGKLVNAFRGSQGVFLMTPPIAPPETHEMKLGKQQADATVEAGVQHTTFSALENVEKITDGKKWAPHFTDKARIEEYIRRLPVASSLVQLAFYYTNLIEYYSPRMDGDTPQLLSMFPSGLPGIALLLLRVFWPIVVFFARIFALLAMAIQFAGAYGKSSGVVSSPAGDHATSLLVAALMGDVAISYGAFESTASAIH